MLSGARSGWLRRLEQERSSRVIALIHRKETVNIMGVPMIEYMDIEDSEAVLRAIRLTDENMPIDLILHTPGGISLVAEQIARALCRHKAKVTVFVPHYAMSGGALIALAAHELVMSPDAVLGSLDPMVGRYPATSLISLTRKKNPADLEDDTLLLVDQAKKATMQMRAALHSLLKLRMPNEKAESIADEFTSGKWTQDYPLSISELREMGIEVRVDLPVAVFQFMSMFPQASKNRPSVEFIPLPYKSPEPVPIQTQSQ